MAGRLPCTGPLDTPSGPDLLYTGSVDAPAYTDDASASLMLPSDRELARPWSSDEPPFAVILRVVFRPMDLPLTWTQGRCVLEVLRSEDLPAQKLGQAATR